MTKPFLKKSGVEMRQIQAPIGMIQKDKMFVFFVLFWNLSIRDLDFASIDCLVIWSVVLKISSRRGLHNHFSLNLNLFSAVTMYFNQM